MEEVALGGDGPGGAPNLTPEDTGIYVPPGGSFAYQMHYTPVGKPTTDKTEVGYYFYKEQPKYILRQASITDFSIQIPPGTGQHMETAYLEFPHDARGVRRAAPLSFALLLDQASHPLPGWH